jgi:UDP-N-acetylmuramoylalanine--D-glutamate ligase
MSLRIGVIGFGVVGTSFLAYLKSSFSYQNPSFSSVSRSISVWDKRLLTESERHMIEQHGARVEDSAAVSLEHFIKNQDIILVSPGVNVRHLVCGATQLLSEADIFAFHWKKPIIAITGSLGKTTVTRMIYALLKLRYNVVMGGNIGTPMLDLLIQQDAADIVVLELSSFQLAYSILFSPTVGVITNLYPNHLDWHLTVDDYIDSKLRCFVHGKEGGDALISRAAFDEVPSIINSLIPSLTRRLTIMSNGPYDGMLQSYIMRFESAQALYVENNFLMKREGKGAPHKLFDMALLPPQSYPINWVIALSAVVKITKDLSWLEEKMSDERNQKAIIDDLKQQHRLEHFATFNGIDFYNDSKSTLTQATQAAVDFLAHNKRPIILILGGVGKGVDRTSFFKTISDHHAVKKVLFLGKDFGKDSYPSLDELTRAIVTRSSSFFTQWSKF